MKKGVESLENEVSVLRREVEAQESEIERLRSENAKLEDEEDHLAAIVKDYEAALTQKGNEYTRDMEEKLEEITELERKLIEARKDRHHVTSTHIEYEDRISSLQDRLKEAIQSSDSAKRARDELRKDHQTALAKSKELQTKLQNSEQAQSKLQAMLESTQEELQETAREFDRAQESMRSMHEDTKSSGLEDRERAVNAQIESQNARRQIAVYSSEIRGLHSELDTRDEFIREKEEATRVMSEEMEDLRNINSQQSHDLLDKIGKIKTLERDLETVKKDLTRRKTRVEELETALRKESGDGSRKPSDYSNQLAERNELLTHLLKAIDQALLTDGRKRIVPRPDGSSFQSFLEAAQNRISSLQKLNGDIQERIELSEKKVKEEFRARDSELDTKLNQLQDFQSRMKVVAEEQSQWREKVERQRAELHQTKVRPGVYIAV